VRLRSLRLLRRARRLRYIGNVWCQLHDHRNRGDFHYPTDNSFRHGRLLTHGRAHAAFTHAVRAAKIEFDAIGPGIHGTFDEFMPALPGVHHQRDHHRAVRPTPFDLGNLAEVGFRRTVAREFYIIEARHAQRAQVERGIARGGIDDGVADGLPDNTAPPRLEGAMGLVGGIRRRPEASQNGLGDLMPARLIDKSAIMQGSYTGYLSYIGFNRNESRAVPLM